MGIYKFIKENKKVEKKEKNKKVKKKENSLSTNKVRFKEQNGFRNSVVIMEYNNLKISTFNFFRKLGNPVQDFEPYIYL